MIAVKRLLMDLPAVVCYSVASGLTFPHYRTQPIIGHQQFTPTSKFTKPRPLACHCYLIPQRFGPATLLIGQRVIVPLRRIIGQILYKLPIVTIWIVVVHTLPVRMMVWRRRVLISCRCEPLAKRVDVVHLVREMIHTRHACVRFPTSLWLECRLRKGNVGLVRSNVNPAIAIRTDSVESHSKVGERRPQKAHRGINIAR